ncbi:hypothetical protein PILCRDRAFT_83759 [Piloderma croceum F 1598]|uniref:methionyl-tRNA formyltransferase n=1 Tax=Piloderma croceum (strain F 1598) TaxID=765440 RepID=A0A0C3CPB6_PILCF|nr:hypothetical protein PILCRDRAFT_83759 [Piloderma croceum F 1598]
MGGDEFSCLVFENLVAAKDVYERIFVATNPPKTVGRGRKKISVSPLEVLAEQYKLPCQYVPPKEASKKWTWTPGPPFTVTPAQNDICNSNQDHLLITASFGRILPEFVIELFPPQQRLNVHPSLLPKYRGAAPIQHAIMNGDRMTGVCVVEMLARKEGIDAGRIWASQHRPILEDTPFESLRDDLALQGGRLLVSLLRDMLAGKAKSKPQGDAEGSPKAPRITAETAIVDFKKMTAQDIMNRHLAIAHKRPLVTYLPSNKSLQLLSLSIYKHPVDKPLQISTPHYDTHSNSLLIRCADDAILSVTRVKQQDRNALYAKEWWNGVRPEFRERDEQGKLAGLLLGLDEDGNPLGKIRSA